MIATEDEKYVLEKKIDKLKKRINSLNEAIFLQANKIADTMTLMVISRDENILQDRIQKKKKAIEELVTLRRELNAAQDESFA
jgi:predicted  nucleic acid-binding Zn-ribbon protein